MVWLDRALSILLILGGVGHSIGSVLNFSNNQMMLLWALCASLFVFLLGAINLLRTRRPGDRPLAWLCLAGGICWIAGAIRFAVLVGNLLDVHAVIFIVITLGLCVFSGRSLMMPKA